MISMEEKIAIVIPAYKCRFLRQTLDSIVVQTCRSFTVYIGDDASPQNLKEIVSDYADKMNIVYRRFDTSGWSGFAGALGPLYSTCKRTGCLVLFR